MNSRLFRRETSRRLRSSATDIIAAYSGRRFSWLDTFDALRQHSIAETIEVLAEAVEQDHPALLADHAAARTEMWVSLRVPPIAIAVMGDALFDSILQVLTPDQEAIVAPMLDAARQQRQALIHALVIGNERRGA